MASKVMHMIFCRNINKAIFEKSRLSKICIVDDCLIQSSYLKSLLKKLTKVEIVVYNDPKGWLRDVEELSNALTFLDKKMPKADGDELCALARAKNPDIGWIISYSTCVRKGSKRELYRIGYNGSLSKPARINDVNRILLRLGSV
ncbi:MAG: response regulator [Bacteroidetes bacterium]|nr:MAG: response regulator [Bacteroidota bacterium]